MSLIRATTLEAAVIEGTAYFIRDFRTLNNNEIKNFAITAPVSPPETIALSIFTDPEGQLLIEIFRGATLNVIPDGIELTLINANESSGSGATTRVLEDPTIDADGELVARSLLGSGRKNEMSGQGDRTNVISLAQEQGTTLYRVTSGSSSNTINFDFDVIEEGG